MYPWKRETDARGSSIKTPFQLDSQVHYITSWIFIFSALGIGRVNFVWRLHWWNILVWYAWGWYLHHLGLREQILYNKARASDRKILEGQDKVKMKKDVFESIALNYF